MSTTEHAELPQAHNWLNITNKLLARSDLTLEPWHYYKPRVFVVSLLSLLVSIVVFNLAFALSGKHFSQLHLSTVSIAVVTLLAIYFYYRISGELRRSVHIFMSVNALILLAFVTLSGGFSSPVLALLIFLPFLAFLMASRRAGYIWTGISIAMYLGFYVAYTQGVSTPQILDPSRIAATQTFGWVILCAGLVVGLEVYGQANEATARELVRQSQSYRQQAHTDQRSGLLNPMGFEQHIRELMQVSDSKIGLMYVRFSGQSAPLRTLSPEDLKQLQRFIDHECRALQSMGLTAARLSLQELGFYLPQIHSSSELSRNADTLHRHLQRGIQLSTGNFVIKARFGISLAPRHARDYAALLASAKETAKLCNSQQYCKVTA